MRITQDTIKPVGSFRPVGLLMRLAHKTNLLRFNKKNDEIMGMLQQFPCIFHHLIFIGGNA